MLAGRQLMLEWRHGISHNPSQILTNAGRGGRATSKGRRTTRAARYGSLTSTATCRRASAKCCRRSLDRGPCDSLSSPAPRVSTRPCSRASSTNLEAAKLVTRIRGRPPTLALCIWPLTDAGRSLFEEMRNERTDALLVRPRRTHRRQSGVIVIEALPVLESLVETLRSRNQ